MHVGGSAGGVAAEVILMYFWKKKESMPTCPQALYDEYNRQMMDKPLQPFGHCLDSVAQKHYYQFEYVNETQLQVNGVPCNVTIGDEWVDLKRAEDQPCFGDITIHRSKYDAIIDGLKGGHPVLIVEFYG